MIVLTVTHRFCAAHKVGDSGKCSRLHGHNYKLETSVLSDSLKDGYIMEASVLKNIIKEKVINELDHQFLNDKLKDVLSTPTCENILIHIVRVLSKELSKDEYNLVSLFKVKLEETHSIKCTWYASV